MKPIDTKEALALLECEGPDIYDLFARANRVRIEHKGYDVNFCGVLNAKSGMCPENCKFCPQSVHSESEVDCYSLVSEQEMVDAAKTAEEHSTQRFGIVTSGEAIEEKEEVERIATAIAQIDRDFQIKPCASLGILKKETMRKLKDAGLTRYHCNLEAAESFFGQICTTHAWTDSVNTIMMAKELGLTTCSGGIFGLGESLAQRVELLAALRDLDVDSVPINFLNPIPGTPLEDVTPVTPIECLKVTAVARLMMPDKTIRICGGREHNLRDLQSWLLMAGANGLMVGGYLTTKGRNIDDDIQMVADAGFKLQGTIQS